MNTLAIILTLIHTGGALPSDVPAGHWAAGDVQQILSRGILTAPNGRFDGDRAVTRRELTIALAQFAKSMLAKKWTPVNSSKAPPSTSVVRATVSRYELAAVLARIARHAAVGLPVAGNKTYYGSEAFPRSAKVKAPTSEPGYAAAQYLAKEHMAFSNSVTLSPGPKPVTPAEVRKAVTMVIVGLVDRLTDEPQNREDISPPVRHR